MELIPDWAPNIHPMIVHFPIAILLLAAFMDLLDFFLPEGWWDELKTTLLYGIGAVSALATYLTGNRAADSVFLPAGAQNVLNEHADWAWWTLWFFGIYLLLRLGLHWYRALDHRAIRIAALVTVLPGLFMLYETGEHGAEMVFGYGAGTGQLLEQEPSSLAASDSLATEAATTFRQSENGSWSWPMGPNAVGALLANFHWLQGSPQQLQPSVLQSDSNYLMNINGDSLNNFFTGHQALQNVQVDYYLDLSGFDGEVELVHHLRDAENYDFVTLTSGGTIRQGRVMQGEREIFAEASYSATGMLFVRVVGNGTHFRGYVNEEMLVHGHGDAPEAGSVGLKLNGSGSLLIDSIQLTQL